MKLLRIAAALPFTCAALFAESPRSQQEREGIQLSRGENNFLHFQLSPKSKDGEHTRANYVHPLYTPDGRVLTEDFPADHLHHRGIFWAWHQVLLDGKPVADPWVCRDIEWSKPSIGGGLQGGAGGKNPPVGFEVVRDWLVPDPANKSKKLPLVRVSTTVTARDVDEVRIIDFDLKLRALRKGVSLGGSKDVKGYGGFSTRITLTDDVKFEGQSGPVKPQRTAVEGGGWMNITETLEGKPVGMTIMVHPSHPGFPLKWILRAKRSMQNPQWPGNQPIALPADADTELKYRLLVHDGSLSREAIEARWKAYIDPPQSRIAGVQVAATSSAQPGFKSLFNGKNLDGWVNVNCAPGTWRATNGLIYCTGFPTGALRTTRQYENFVLELEWRHLKAGGNAGVFLWSGPIGAQGVPFLRAVEVQVLDHGYITPNLNKSYTTHGDVFPIHGSTMKPFGPHRGQRSFPSERHSNGAPEWNHYRIECNNGTLWLWVNGHKVSGGEDCNWRKGYIALESEGSPIEFKNIRLKELPSTGATKEQTAPLAEGHRSLYTGVDLKGWKSEGIHGWASRDWRLVNEGTPGNILWSEALPENFEFIVDCKLREKGEQDAGSIILGVGKESIVGIPLGLVAVPNAPYFNKHNRGFHRFHITVHNEHARVTINGIPVNITLQPIKPAGARHRIGIVGSKVGVELSGFYLRELD